MYQLIFTYLLSPIHYLVRTFLFFLIFFFLFSFLCEHKNHKNANKRISDFSPLDVFEEHFLFLSICVFVLLSVYFFVLLVLLVLLLLLVLFVRDKSFCKKKKKKEFKTALITSFILLLRFGRFGGAYKRLETGA